MGKMGTPKYHWKDYKLVQSLRETMWQPPLNFNILILYGQAIPVLGMYLIEKYTNIHNEEIRKCYIAALFHTNQKIEAIQMFINSKMDK